MVLLFRKDFGRFHQTATTPWGMTSFQYYPDGPVRNIFRPNGTTTEYTFDRAARTETISHKRGLETFSSYNYAYDGNGNRTMQIEYQNGVAETTTYGYDGADRLTHVEYPGEILDYGYDGVGNRLSETKTEKGSGNVLSAKTLAYNALNQLTAITDSADQQNDVTLNYDDNGNLVTKTTATGTTEYLYDTQNRLIGVSTNGNEVATYEYDAQGMRIGKQSLASTVSYVRDGLDVLTEYDAADTAIASYQYGNGLLSLHDATEGTAWYHEDTLGSPVVLTSSTGTQEASYKYEAFGLLKEKTGLSYNSHLFTEKELDQETGLYYFGARYYDPEIGRFITQDTYLGEPTTPGSLHRYLYAYANPTVYVDLTGHSAFEKELFGFSALEELSAVLSKGSDYMAGRIESLNATRKELGRASIPFLLPDAIGAKGAKALLQTLRIVVDTIDYDVDLSAAVAPLSLFPNAQTAARWRVAESGVSAVATTENVLETVSTSEGRATLGNRAIQSGKDYGSKLLEGDLDASAGLVIGVVDLVLGTHGVGKVGKIEELGELGSSLTRTAERLGQKTRPILDDLGRILADETGGIGGKAVRPGRIGGVTPHPADPKVPGGIENYRGRYQASLRWEGLQDLPGDWDVHHSIPQQLRYDPRVRGYDIDHPTQTRGLQGYSQPGPETNVHSVIDQEWRKYLRSHPDATREEILNFRDYLDWRFGHTYWENIQRTREGGGHR